MAINPLTLYFATAPTQATGYTNVAIPSTLNSSTLSQDQRVLTYALAAELLESTLYQQAYLYLTGQPLPGTTATSATDALGNVYGAGGSSLGVSASDPLAQYLAEFGQVEAEHAASLIGVLGGNPYAGLGVQFAFGLSGATKLLVAEAVYGAELTGVSAYLGAIPSFTTKSPYLQAAASILGTEARHTTALAYLVNTLTGSATAETAPQYNEGPIYGVGTQGHGMDVPLAPDLILNQGGSGVPGSLNSGAITPLSGPNGAAVTGPGGTPAYRGYVYQVTV